MRRREAARQVLPLGNSGPLVALLSVSSHSPVSVPTPSPPAPPFASSHTVPHPPTSSQTGGTVNSCLSLSTRPSLSFLNWNLHLSPPIYSFLTVFIFIIIITQPISILIGSFSGPSAKDGGTYWSGLRLHETHEPCLKTTPTWPRIAYGGSIRIATFFQSQINKINKHSHSFESYKDTQKAAHITASTHDSFGGFIFSVVATVRILPLSDESLATMTILSRVMGSERGDGLLRSD